MSYGFSYVNPTDLKNCLQGEDNLTYSFFPYLSLITW